MTRKEIQYKINQLTKQLNNYTSEKNSYSNSLGYAKKLVSSLNTSLQYLNTTNDNLKSSFTINGKTADGGKVEETKNEVNAVIREVNNSVIPDINSNIKTLTNKINNINSQLYTLRRQLQNATE